MPLALSHCLAFELQLTIRCCCPRPDLAAVLQAIWEPTFCSLYAEVCVRLSKHLPEFPPAEGEDKPMTFRRVLLNTCQARPPPRRLLAARQPGMAGMAHLWHRRQSGWTRLCSRFATVWDYRRIGEPR